MKKKLCTLTALAAASMLLAACGKEAGTTAPAPAPEPAVEAPADDAAVTDTTEADDTSEASSPDDTATAENPDAVDTSAEDTANDTAASLPPYEYPGPELFYSIMYKYIVDEFGQGYSEAQVGIPCPIIIAMDESDKDDIKVWGNFWYFNYDLKGDILENVAGGSHPGLMHFKSSDTEGYEITGFDAVGDGSDYDPTAKEIFGSYYEDFIKSNDDAEGLEKTRAQIIANYAAANNLSISAYQDYGWDPVPLPEENIDSFYSTLD